MPDEASICYNKSMPRIITTDDPNYIAYCKNYHQNGRGAHNGAYYYSKEIVKNIIPNVKTNRPWDTLGMKFMRSYDHAIVFLHHCINWEKVYYWLREYKDQVLVCSTLPTYEWAKTVKGAHPVFLPLSIDIEEVQKHKAKKTKKACYAGNRWAFKRADENKNIPEGVDFPPPNLPREEMLEFIAPYREIYAIGRCALEGLALGCKIKPFYHVYPDPNYWKLLDNKDAAKLLQEALDQIDGQTGMLHNPTNPS